MFHTNITIRKFNRQQHPDTLKSSYKHKMNVEGKAICPELTHKG